MTLSSGGSPGGATDWPYHLKASQAAILNNVDPNFASDGSDASEKWDAHYKDSWGGFTLKDVLKTVGNGENPFDGVEAYDASEDLDKLDDRVQDFLDIAEDWDADDLFKRALSRASETFSGLEHEDQVEAAIDSQNELSKVDFLRGASRVMAGMFDARAVQGIGASMVLADMEHDRALRMDDYAARLRLGNVQQRTQSILSFVNSYMQQAAIRMDAMRSAAALQFDATKMKAVQAQDEIEFNLQMATKAKLWKLELFQYYSNGIASMYGAPVLPRAQTERERLMSAVMSSVGAALQGGVASGNPIGGLAIGAGTLGAQLYGQGYDIK